MSESAPKGVALGPDDLNALRATHRDSYPMGSIHHGTPENPNWGTFCVECVESWPCTTTRLLDHIDASAPTKEALTPAQIVTEQYEAYLHSDRLDPAWIAGWHSAINHAAAVLTARETPSERAAFCVRCEGDRVVALTSAHEPGGYGPCPDCRPSSQAETDARPKAWLAARVVLVQCPDNPANPSGVLMPREGFEDRLFAAFPTCKEIEGPLINGVVAITWEDDESSTAELVARTSRIMREEFDFSTASQAAN